MGGGYYAPAQGFEGFGFQFSAPEESEFVRFAPKEPQQGSNAVVAARKTVCPGLNFEGECSNQNCEAFEKTVYVRGEGGGFGIFDIAAVTANLECPVCGSVLENVFHAVMYLCRWSYEGVVYDVPARVRSPTLDSLQSFQKVRRSSRGEARSKEGVFVLRGRLAFWRYLRFKVVKIEGGRMVD